jgi:hypothetical protein
MENYIIDMDMLSDDEWILNCPICGHAWIKTSCDGPFDDESPCSHLRFRWTEYGVDYFGKWDINSFEEAYLEAYHKLYGEDLSGDIFSCSLDHDVLENINHDDVDEVASWILSGMACGPVSFRTDYGIKK